MSLPENPITRNEMYLSKIAGEETQIPDHPVTREEMYLDYIARHSGDQPVVDPYPTEDSENLVASGGVFASEAEIKESIGDITDELGNTDISSIGNGKVTGAIAFLHGKNAWQSQTAGFHNEIYRGNNITNYLTDGSLWNRIKGAGGYELFEDLYLGDYITVGNNSYAIVDFDYYIRCGSVDITEHHVVMMPTANMNIPEGTVLYGSEDTLELLTTANVGETVTYQEGASLFKWNATKEDPNTHTTKGGYKYSRIRQVIMKAADTIVTNAFGVNHVKPITVLYHNPSDENASGVASGWTWFADDDWSSATRKSICDLPNETQIYGQQVWGRGSAYTNMGYEVGIDKFQFSICALHRVFVNIRAVWWLRSVYSAAIAAYVGGNGNANYGGSASTFGVRPRFLLVG